MHPPQSIQRRSRQAVAVWLALVMGLCVACMVPDEELVQRRRSGLSPLITPATSIRAVAQSPLAIPTATLTRGADWPLPTPMPTGTPIVARVVVNEAEGLPAFLIYIFQVQRAGGELELYLLPMSRVPLTWTQAYQEFRADLLQLQPGDYVEYEGQAWTRPRGVPEPE